MLIDAPASPDRSPSLLPHRLLTLIALGSAEVRFDAHKNFAYSTVATAPSPATSGTSLVVQTGDGTKFPGAPFNATVWPAGAIPTSSNAEIVRITAVSTDTFTITRAQESTSAVSIANGYQIMAAVTEKTLTDIEGSFPVSCFAGLQLRTHPDADKSANQVALLNIDLIVMDDGTRYSGLTLPLAADITVNGLGGLDTGSRVASTWYEIHAIGKSSSGAASDVGLLLHRAKNYGLDQSSTSTGSGSDLASTSATTLIAQSFTAGASGLMERVDLSFIRTGTLSGYTIKVELQSDNGGEPSGTALATSDALNASAISSASHQPIAFLFRSPYAVVESTKYWLVFTPSYAVNASNYLNSDGTASGSGASTYSGSAWSTITNKTLYFKTYVTENDTAISFPTGYDQSCQLGWVYNSSSNVLSGFINLNGDVEPLEGASIASTSVAVPQLIDLSAVVPPTPVMLHTLFANATAGNRTACAGPDGYGYGANARAQGGVAIAAAVANAYFSGPDVAVDFQAGYLASPDTTSATIYKGGYRWR